MWGAVFERISSKRRGREQLIDADLSIIRGAMKTHGFLSSVLLRFAHGVCRSYIRHAPRGIGSEFMWSHICRPYLNWRCFSAVKPTSFGSRIHCNVSDMIQAHIYYFGQWEPNLTAFLMRRLRTGDTFIDVGANIGYFSLLASCLVGSEGRIVAIEASPKIYKQLKENITRNATRNIRSVNIAASDRHGVLDLYRGVAGNQGSTTLLPTLGTLKEATVPAAPFDEILSYLELSRARVIKIDIEGAELPVLKNILSRIQDFRLDLEIVVELNPHNNNEVKADQVIECFKRVGFFCYYLTNEFSIPKYLGRIAAFPPQRLKSTIIESTDLVFSREEADFV